MSIPILASVLLPMIVLVLQRDRTGVTVRRLAMASLIPLILLAAWQWVTWAGHGEFSVDHLIGTLLLEFCAAFVLSLLRISDRISLRQPMALLIIALIVLLLCNVPSPVPVILLASLPALLVHRLGRPTASAVPPRGNIFSRASAGLVAPSSFLAGVSVVSAMFIPNHNRILSYPAGAALGIAVSALIWQLLLMMISGAPAANTNALKGPKDTTNFIWLLQRRIRAISAGTLFIALFHLRFYIQQSPFSQSVMVIIAVSTLLAVGSLLLMERRLLNIFSFMEYFWIALLLIGIPLTPARFTGTLAAMLATTLIIMAVDGWLSRLLTASEGGGVDLDSIIGWRFTRLSTAMVLGLFILVMQLVPIMPACHFFIPLLSLLAEAHPWLVGLILTANGAMLVAAFRILGAMYVPSGKIKT